MTSPARDLNDLEWVGGVPVLDFVNTVHAWREGKPGDEYLRDFDTLLEWARQAGLIDSSGVDELRTSSERAWQRAMRTAVRFRSTVHSLFQGLVYDGRIQQWALDEITSVIRKTMQYRSLSLCESAIIWRWDFRGAPPNAVLGPVAWSACDLLQGNFVPRIKECPGPEGCGWLFLDHSKNRSRTWCSMKTCGNAAKVRRYRARQQ